MSIQDFLSSPIGQVVGTIVFAGVIAVVFQQMTKASARVRSNEPLPGAKSFSQVAKRDKAPVPKQQKSTASKKFSARETTKWAPAAESVVPQVSALTKPQDHRVKSPTSTKKEAAPTAAVEATAAPKAKGGFEVVGRKTAQPASPSAAAAAAVASAAPEKPNVMDIIFQSSTSRPAGGGRGGGRGRGGFSAPRPTEAAVAPPAGSPGAAASPGVPAKPVQISSDAAGARGWAKLEPVAEEEE